MLLPLLLTVGLLLAACDNPTRSGQAACGDRGAIPAGAGYAGAVQPGASAREYESHPPILIEDVHATAADPFVVEGYEISSSSANCIEVRNSENIVIRGNYLHDCTWTLDPADPYSQEEGFALLIGKSGSVLVEDNLLERNKMGLAVHSSSDIDIRHNTIRTTRLKNSLRLERVTSSTVAANLLEDNGTPEEFWAPGHRVIGIYLVRSHDIDVYDNTVLRSSSDGISVGGQIDCGGLTTRESDWTGTASHIRIYNNLVLDNMELGMWLVRARGLDIHHNTIRTGCFTHGPGIGLDFDVDDSEVYANKIVTCLNRAHVSLAMSHDNHIHDNVHYTADGEHDPVVARDDPDNDRIKAGWAGIPFIPSSGNRVENDFHFRVGGALGQAIEEHLALAEAEDTWEEKGWFSCEIEEGVLDDACVAAQAALGVQGIPSHYLLFDPLMADPDPYVLFEDCP